MQFLPLTKRQQQVLDFIKDFIKGTGYPFTRKEIAQGLFFKSPNAAQDHLKVLAKKGVIKIYLRRHRGIVVLATKVKD